ncbi:MAG: hypothetical protein ABJO67_00415 [Pseudoruegeria sp.]
MPAIPANPNQSRGIESKEGLPPDLATRMAEEYLETQDDAAFGAAINYLVDLDNAVIVDVEPSVPIRTTEAFAARRVT